MEPKKNMNTYSPFSLKLMKESRTTTTQLDTLLPSTSLLT
jgi:hypothetical protein